VIFIVDWGYTTEKEIGPISKDDIHLDSPTDFVQLIRVKIWFRAFFIPIIPTQVHYYFLSEKDRLRHEICKEDFERYKPMAELNNLVVNNKISEEEYESKWSNLTFG